MNLLQAIEQAGDNWFRPVGSIAMAFTFHVDHFCSTDGKHCIYNVNLMKQDFICEWEIVTPEQVMSERK